jgi:cation diffusion facilitator family transporter
VGIFVAGAGFSLFEAVRAFSESPKSAEHNFLINYIVFGFAAIAEAVSWIRAYRQTRAEAKAQNRSLSQHIRLSPDPSVKTVASEDTVAVIGDVLGLAATGLQQLTGQPLWDGVAALVIMVMLIFVAFALARDNKDLLIGEAIEPEKEQRIHQLPAEEPGIAEVLDVRSMRIGTEQVLIAARVDVGDDIDGSELQEVAEHADEKLRTELPEVSLMFIHPRRSRNQDSGTNRNRQASAPTWITPP